MIRLADVAQVTGGDAALQERVKGLDLEDAASARRVIVHHAATGWFRLRIAGIDADAVSIRGTAVRVTARRTKSPRGPATLTSAVATTTASSLEESPRGGPLERAVIKAAEDCVLARLPWKADDVSIRLAQPLVRGSRSGRSGFGLRMPCRVANVWSHRGTSSSSSHRRSSAQPSFDVAVLLDVRHFDNVVLTAKALERGQTIAAADVYVDRQDVTGMADSARAQFH